MTGKAAIVPDRTLQPFQETPVFEIVRLHGNCPPGMLQGLNPVPQTGMGESGEKVPACIPFFDPVKHVESFPETAVCNIAESGLQIRRLFRTITVLFAVSAKRTVPAERIVPPKGP